MSFHVLIILLLLKESASIIKFCDKKICRKNEECKESTKGYSCTKLFNETINTCDEYPCGYELKCKEIEENYLKMGYMCICKIKNIACKANSPNVCDNDKDICYNGGICQLNINHNGYVCSCKAGKYTGDYCTKVETENTTTHKVITMVPKKIETTQLSGHFGLKRKIPIGKIMLINCLIIAIVLLLNTILCVMPVVITKFCY